MLYEIQNSYKAIIIIKRSTGTDMDKFRNTIKQTVQKDMFSYVKI